MIPDGWKRKNLGEVITLQRGFDLPEQDRIHGTIPIISSSGITGFHN
jgi:type I restriction enzyme, S subunit